MRSSNYLFHVAFFRQEELGVAVNYKAPKFLVYKECLVELLQYCPKCSCGCDVTWHVIGTFVAAVRRCCNCDYSHKWCSQPLVNDIPAGNIHLSAAMYISGASFAKTERVFAALRMKFFCSSTFYRHIQQFVQPTILSVWNDHQKQLLHSLIERPGDVVLGGDMRADSPGHCAKYGSYTMMELRANRVIDVSLIQVIGT